MLDHEKRQSPGGGEQQENINPGEGPGFHGRLVFEAVERRRQKSELRLRS